MSYCSLRVAVRFVDISRRPHQKLMLLQDTLINDYYLLGSTVLWKLLVRNLGIFFVYLLFSFV